MIRVEYIYILDRSVPRISELIATITTDDFDYEWYLETHGFCVSNCSWMCSEERLELSNDYASIKETSPIIQSPGAQANQYINGITQLRADGVAWTPLSIRLDAEMVCVMSVDMWEDFAIIGADKTERWGKLYDLNLQNLSDIYEHLLKNAHIAPEKTPYCDEWCAHCESEVRIPKDHPSKCPVCGEDILPCSMCDLDNRDCSDCPHNTK